MSFNRISIALAPRTCHCARSTNIPPSPRAVSRVHTHKWRIAFCTTVIGGVLVRCSGGLLSSTSIGRPCGGARLGGVAALAAERRARIAASMAA